MVGWSRWAQELTSTGIWDSNQARPAHTLDTGLGPGDYG